MNGGYYFLLRLFQSVLRFGKDYRQVVNGTAFLRRMDLKAQSLCSSYIDDNLRFKLIRLNTVTCIKGLKLTAAGNAHTGSVPECEKIIPAVGINPEIRNIIRSGIKPHTLIKICALIGHIHLGNFVRLILTDSRIVCRRLAQPYIRCLIVRGYHRHMRCCRCNIRDRKSERQLKFLSSDGIFLSNACLKRAV